MKILFAHDHKFYRGTDGLYYSSGQFPYRIWQRYLDVFDEIVVVGRVNTELPGETEGKRDLSSGPRVSFVEIPNLNEPIAMIVKRREAERRIREVLMDCDALVARGSTIGEVAIGVAKQMGKPWALEVVSCPFDALWNYGTWQGKVYAPYAAYKTRQLTKEAPYVVYVTEKFLQGRYPCRGRSIGCSNVQLSKSDKSVLEQRLARINKGGLPFSIGLIGSLSNSYKGIDVALEALSQVKAQLPPFEFRILGAGDPEKWKRIADQKGLAGQTVFCGTLANGTAVNLWLDEIDLYIQPSFQEGLPRALVEAMNRGCPALGSSAGGIPELLDDSCIHKAGDSKKLAVMLKHASVNKQWQARQAMRNFSEAARYDKSVLDPRRRQFWTEFANFCKNGPSDNLRYCLQGQNKLVHDISIHDMQCGRRQHESDVCT